MSLADIFNGDAFTMHNLTASIDKLPYVPGRVEELKLFTNKPTTTRTAYIEERQGQLALLPVKARGEMPSSTSGQNPRKMRPFEVPHVPQHRTILAESLEGKRAFGSETETEVYATLVNDELAEMKVWHEVTHEWHRLGALKGIVLDADASTVVYNFFTEFGLSQTQLDFNKYDSGTYDAADPAVHVRTLCTSWIRSIRDALGATPYKGVHALCGDNYFDALIEHATVRGAYKNYTAAQEALGGQKAGEGQVFSFGGIDFENYRGSIGDVDFVDTDEAVIFPKGAPNVFLEIPAPATFIETINTRGQMLYAKQKVMDWDLGVELFTQSNVLYICTRPGCLIKSLLTNTAPGSGS